MRPFSPGDTVIYPAHGVGTVQSIETSTVNGAVQPMYRIWFARQQMTVHVPLDNQSLREITTKKAMEQALQKLIANRKKVRGYPHQVQRFHNAKLTSGVISELTQLVCNLFVPEGEERSYANLQLAEEATARLVDELSLIMELPDSTVYGLVEEALTTKKLPPELKRL